MRSFHWGPRWGHKPSGSSVRSSCGDECRHSPRCDLWLVWQVRIAAAAQGNGHFGQRSFGWPASATFVASDQRQRGEPSLTDIERRSTTSRKSQTIAAAAHSARAGRTSIGGGAGSSRSTLCREKSLPEATLRGIVEGVRVSRDPSILPVSVDVLRAPATLRATGT